MFFLVVLILTALSIAGSAAFFSIYGLAQIFTGSFWPVVIMASSLEAGKLVSASYVYRYWDKITFLMKTYLLATILILMVITSAGIFGFLSSAYQLDILPLEDMQEQIILLDQKKIELADLKQEKIARREQINAIISAFPDNYATKKAQARAEFKPEMDKLNIDIDALSTRFQSATEEQHQLKRNVIQQRVHTGPIIFIAKAFNYEVDDATKWMILLIIFAFDPLAVILTVGANIAIIERRGGKDYLFYQPPTESLTPEPKIVEKVIIQPATPEPTIKQPPTISETLVVNATNATPSRDIDFISAPAEEGSPQQIFIQQGVNADDLQRILDARFDERDKSTPIPEQTIIHQGMDADALQKMLDERFSQHDKLTPEQLLTKTLIEETLARKRVTQRIRMGKG